MNLVAPVSLSRLSGPSRPEHLRNELLSDLFVASATRQPNKTALIGGERKLSYAELQNAADRVAWGLKARGIGRGAFVGLWMARGLDLHVALLGILRAGAAYIPFDADAPPDRVAVCMADCGAAAILIDDYTAKRSGTLQVPILRVEQMEGSGTVDPRLEGGNPDDPAYAIYTSGSTGTPKAVIINHRNICHYLRAANDVYGLVAEDVVFQGASVAFDLSLEEIFLPYMVGATLWVAGRHVLEEADRLCDVFDAAGITVLDTVPTLLTLLPRDVPSLRVIILGGEACPPSVAERWCRPGRHLFNSYGPTEATVVATIDEVQPGAAITIGRPIANTCGYVVDDELRPVAMGGTGELLLGGPGIALGYYGRPELTAEKFIPNPFHQEGGCDPILYRTGDAVAIDDNGRLVFHGRIDDQVKIRGFRVELGEIEAKLSACPSVAQPAVILRNDDGTDRLVAFVVLMAGAEMDSAALRAELRAQLPCYMVPSHFEAVETLPRMISGKIDRKSLQAWPLAVLPVEDEEEPATPTEASLLAAAHRVFPGQSLPLEADFFLELGGHSLLAARFVSFVRETQSLSGLTLQDVYAARNIRAMAARLDGRAQASDSVPRNLGFTPPPLLRRFLCGAAQAAVLPVILGLATVPWLGVFVSYMLLSGDDADFLREVVTLLTTYSFINLGTVIIAVSLKWLVLGRTRPGRYPLWGVYYFRWWLVQRVLGLVHIKWFQDTPVMRYYLRLLGAKVGRDAILGEVESGAYDLVTIGKGATIASRVRLCSAEVIGNELVIGHVDIGDWVGIGNSTVLGLGCVVGEGAEIGDLTVLPSGHKVGAYERWDGSPATMIGKVNVEDLPEAAEAGPVRRAALVVATLMALVVLPPISLLPIFPAFMLFDKLADFIARFTPVNYLYYVPVVSWPTAMLMILVTVVLIAAFRWVVLPRVSPGTYSIHSGFYFRKWMVALCTELTLETLSSLYATVYMRAWYRLMGARIGRDAEISTNLSGRYDLIEIGEKSFIADEVVLGDEVISRGWLVMERVRTGARVFVGNEAVIPPGADIPADVLIGIKSKPPSNEEMAGGGIWFGSPPIKLPVRQQFAEVGSNWTYEPPRWRRIWRGVFEAFAVSLPTMLFITFGTYAVEWLSPAVLAGAYFTVLWQFLVSSVAISVALMLTSALVKWMMMGAYRPIVKPMWSWWALRTEAVAVMYWGMAGKVLLDHLRGSPFLPWVMRIFGTRFGHGVYMDTTDITEFDCVTIGSFAAINAGSALQTHLYEDRVMKVGRVVVGKGVTIGSAATVLYDTHIGDFARIGPLTIVMKGEEIPPHSSWQGAPAQACSDTEFGDADDVGALAAAQWPLGREVEAAE